MAFVVVAVSLFIVALGSVGVVAPQQLINEVKSWQTPAGLYMAAAIRLALGAGLFFAAPSSKAPDTLRVLGVIALIAGVVTPMLGLERFSKLLDWWSARGLGVVRAWGGVAVVIGLLLLYSVVP